MAKDNDGQPSTWSNAVVNISFHDGTYTVWAETDGSSEKAARNLAERILGFLAKDRFAFIRCDPTASTEVQHDTQQTTHRGLVRFSFRDQPGEWERPEESDDVQVHSFSLKG